MKGLLRSLAFSTLLTGLASFNASAQSAGNQPPPASSTLSDGQLDQVSCQMSTPRSNDQDDASISIERLTCEFGKVIAVDQIGRRVPYGEIFGLSGAGTSLRKRTVAEQTGFDNCQ